MHTVGRDPLQATLIWSAIGRLKLYVVLPRRDRSRHRRSPSESILASQQSKLSIRQISKRCRG